jgi:hypothetical protein
MYGITKKTSKPPFFVGRDMIVGNAVWFGGEMAAEQWLETICAAIGLRCDDYVVLPRPKRGA